MSLMPRPARTASRQPRRGSLRRNPYERFRDRDFTLGDYLAIDRTILANERTALAYGRTALAMIIIGGSSIKFFTDWYMWAIGGVFIAGAGAIAIIGWRRCRRMSRYLGAALERETGAREHPLRDDQAKAQPGAAAGDGAGADAADIEPKPLDRDPEAARAQ